MPRMPKVPKYDSVVDTTEHISEVRHLLYQVIDDLEDRARAHDASKLKSPEKEMFDEFTPKLRRSEYGSDEYKGFLKEMGPGLQHHYESNDHHPEHHKDGIDGMHLGQLIEMLADWKAATLRHDGGDLEKSIRQNAERFGYGSELLEILLNTARAYGWI